MKTWKINKMLRKTGVLGAFLALLFFCGMDAKAVRISDATISEGVYVGPVDVSGMTKKEAKEAVKDYIKGLRSENIDLTYQDQTMQLQVKKTGFSWANEEVVDEAVKLGKSGNIIERYKSLKDLQTDNKIYPINTSVKKSKIKSALEKFRSNIDQEAVNAELSKDESGFVIKDGQMGVSLDTDATAKEIATAFGDSWNGEEISLEMKTDSVEPKATREQFELVKDVLGSYQTNYSTGTGRSQNVANGASKINGTVLLPGDEFSVYQTVSPFDAENGYELAGSYENGSVVQTYGGGICQVSTTLFNAVLYAELDVTQRSEHSMIVTYVDPSRDAAISGEYKDFKFVNNTDAPIYIEGMGLDGTLSFTIYGHETRPQNRKVDFESETTSETQPGTVLQASASDPIGTFSTVQKAHMGKSAKLWKVVYEDGVETSRDVIFESNYNVSPEIISVGTASANPAAVSAMSAAIASGDLGACQSVAASYSGSAASNDAGAQGDAAQGDQAAQDGGGSSKKKSKKKAEATAESTATEAPAEGAQ